MLYFSSGLNPYIVPKWINNKWDFNRSYKNNVPCKGCWLNPKRTITTAVYNYFFLKYEGSDSWGFMHAWGGGGVGGRKQLLFLSYYFKKGDYWVTWELLELFSAFRVHARENHTFTANEQNAALWLWIFSLRWLPLPLKSLAGPLLLVLMRKNWTFNKHHGHVSLGFVFLASCFLSVFSYCLQCIQLWTWIINKDYFYEETFGSNFCFAEVSC